MQGCRELVKKCFMDPRVGCSTQDEVYSLRFRASGFRFYSFWVQGVQFTFQFRVLGSVFQFRVLGLRALSLGLRAFCNQK